MNGKAQSSGSLAASITKSASKQTYYTIRLFVDRERAADAYRAYGYFRWVDDVIDDEAGSVVERIAFVSRQRSLLEPVITVKFRTTYPMKSGCWLTLSKMTLRRTADCRSIFAT